MCDTQSKKASTSRLFGFELDQLFRFALESLGRRTTNQHVYIAVLFCHCTVSLPRQNKGPSAHIQQASCLAELALPFP
jgi:hypothetical protein